MSEKKSKLVPIIILLVFILVVGSLFFTIPSEQQTQTTSDIEDTLDDVADSVEDIKGDEQDDVTASSILPDNDVDISTLTETAEVQSLDLDNALQARVLGDPNAPVKIAEYSSFSCGHCGNFHRNVYADLKANWIDTGKAYLVFSDFPLNAPALHASLVGRCITDNDQYFTYVEEVFAKQGDWAYQRDHLGPLQEIAANYGVDSDQFAACVQNQDLQNGLMSKLRAAQQQFNVDSTPSFVINNAVTIAGSANYETFNKTLIEAIEASEAPAETAPE